jgi:hypothetical protein
MTSAMRRKLKTVETVEGRSPEEYYILEPAMILKAYIFNSKLKINN